MHNQLTVVSHRALYQEAEAFINQLGAELDIPHQDRAVRLAEIAAELEATGTYTHTAGELTYGAKLAWRNSIRCIGRLFWDSLIVQDARAAKTEEEVADAVFRHIEYATNGGKILPTLTIFTPSTDAGRPRIRIWNEQLVRYAGYKQADGSVIGDPVSTELTQACEQMGWRGAGRPSTFYRLSFSSARARHAGLKCRRTA